MGKQKQTVVSRGAEGGLMGDCHSEMELDAIITVCVRLNGCFCSRLDPGVFNGYITVESRHFSHACLLSSSSNRGWEMSSVATVDAAQHYLVKPVH